MHIAGLLCFLNIFLYCLKEYSETLQTRLNLLSILLITMYFCPVITGIYYLAAVRQPLNKNSTFLLSFSIHIGIVLISHKKLTQKPFEFSQKSKSISFCKDNWKPPRKNIENSSACIQAFLCDETHLHA